MSDESPGDIPMMDLFRVEAETQLAALAENLSLLEEGVSDPERLKVLMRAAHSLKGAARIVGFDPVVVIAHAMEDCFVAAQEGTLTLTNDDVEALLRALDTITRLTALKEPDLAPWTQSHAVELESLRVALASIASPSAKPAVPAAAGGSPPPSSSPVAAPPLPLPPPPAPPPPGPDLSECSLLQLFQVETDSQTQLLSDGLLALEGQADPAPLLQGLMRAAHSLKGAARIVGLDPVVNLAHTLEDRFVDAQRGRFAVGPEQVDALLSAVDWLKTLARLPENYVETWVTENAAEFERRQTEVGGLGSGAVVAKAAVASAQTDAPEPEPPTAGPAPPASAVPAPAVPPTPPGATPPTPPTGTPFAPAPKAETADRAVRVSAESLEQLMGLAAESLVASGRFQSFSAALLDLKTKQRRLGATLASLTRGGHSGLLSGPDAALLRESERLAEECRTLINDLYVEFDLYAGHEANLSDRLYRGAVATRMRPFGDGTSGFPRLVRDVARSLGKKAQLTILGKSTEVDREILEKLEAPLNHTLRNAVDHGLERPEVRVARGKPPTGAVKLEARHLSGMLAVTVSDDGAGVDLDRLRRKVVDKGLVSAAVAAGLGQTELLEFPFLPGFSTAENVTEISGRGVGLDVVLTMVQHAGGTARITTQPGQGTTMHLLLPITRSVIRALIVEIAGEPYAFPLARIDRVLKLPHADIRYVEDHPYFPLEGRNLGLVQASRVLELNGPPLSAETSSVLVLSDQLNQYGLAVDRCVGQHDLVVRPLDRRLGKVPDISSASLLRDGTAVLIVDVDDLVRSIDNLLRGGRLGRGRWKAAATATRRRKRILVADDSITVREIERQMLTHKGYEVEVAVDGMDAWNAARLGQFDLVVSDVDMPRMTGIELVQNLKRDARCKTIPIMIVSYKDRDADRRRGLEAGADYYLTKGSFQDQTFINAVVDLVGEPEA